jgi:hypothetical protein
MRKRIAIEGLTANRLVAGKSPQAALRKLLPVCNATGDALAGKTAKTALASAELRLELPGYLAFDCG